MRLTRAILPSLVATAIAFSCSPAFAASTKNTEARNAAIEISAQVAKKKKAKKKAEVVHYRRWGPANDPSIAPDGRPYPGPTSYLGACVQVMCYGRWAACSNH
jgi:hypothetical protein